MHWINDNLIEFDDVTIALELKATKHSLWLLRIFFALPKSFQYMLRSLKAKLVNLKAKPVKEMTLQESPDSTRQKFTLAKSRNIVDRYKKKLAGEKTERILELGIFKGGSAVLFHKMLNPVKLIALDLNKTRVGALDDYISSTKTENIIKPYYGVNQADAKTVTQIITSEFNSEPIDVVFDDASHFYAETKASFNIIFPFLRQGGYYIIEDWAWAHWPGDLWQKDGGIWANKPALSNLIFELLMLCATHHSHLIESVDIDQNNAIIKKGCAASVGTDFDISNLYKNRGKKDWYI